MHFTNSVQFLHLAGQGRGFSGTSGIRSAEMSVCGIRTCAHRSALWKCQESGSRCVNLLSSPIQGGGGTCRDLDHFVQM